MVLSTKGMTETLCINVEKGPHHEKSRVIKVVTQTWINAYGKKRT